MGIRGARRVIARRHLARRVKRRPGKSAGRGMMRPGGGGQSGGGASGPNPLANDPNFE